MLIILLVDLIVSMFLNLFVFLQADSFAFHLTIDKDKDKFCNKTKKSFLFCLFFCFFYQ